MQETATIYIELPEEGSPTIRPTEAVPLGDNTFKVLPTPDYDPEDEFWEYPPGSIVRGEKKIDYRGNEILVAVEEIVEKNSVTIYMPLMQGREGTARPTEAVALGDGKYKVLPTSKYDPSYEVWRFLPGSIVRCKPYSYKNSDEIQLAHELVEEVPTFTIYIDSMDVKCNAIFPAQAIDAGRGRYQILTMDYDVIRNKRPNAWPGCIVRCTASTNPVLGEIQLISQQVWLGPPNRKDWLVLRGEY